MTQRDETRIPVIVGVGQVNDRSDGGADSLDSQGLMLAALRAADADGGGGWLAGLNALSVVAQISFPHLGDVSRPLAEAIGASSAHCAQSRYPGGDSPIKFLDEAANRIRAGEIESAVIVGGEALRTAAKRAAANAGAATNAVRDVSDRSAKPLPHRYGLVAPVDVYPLYENATRAAFKQTLVEAQRESAEIWSRFSEVAAANPHAWLHTPKTADDILAASADNRPIAFPYTKLMVANSSVNQGAAFIVASLAKAKAMGLSEAHLVYVGYGAAGREAIDILQRPSYAKSASLDLSIAMAMEANGLKVEELDAVELYSCFPCIPKMARRALKWPIEKPATVFGGLTFGGGPIGNYMSHAVACMVERLRREGQNGFLFANGGFATTNHCIALTRDAARVKAEPRDHDMKDFASVAVSVPPVIEQYTGSAQLETYTIFYDRAGEIRSGVVIARTEIDERILCKVEKDDKDSLAFMLRGDCIGSRGAVTEGADGLLRWRAT